MRIEHVAAWPRDLERSSAMTRRRASSRATLRSRSEGKALRSARPCLKMSVPGQIRLAARGGPGRALPEHKPVIRA